MANAIPAATGIESWMKKSKEFYSAGRFLSLFFAAKRKKTTIEGQNKELMSTFRIKDLGPIHYYLVLEFQQNITEDT